MRGGVTEPFEVRHLRALIQSFAFLIHERPVKLTTKRTKDTKNLLTVGPGALIGEMALIDDSPRTASAVAKTSCRLAEIDRRRFHFLVQQTPHFATHVMKTLADRLRRMNAVAAAR